MEKALRILTVILLFSCLLACGKKGASAVTDAADTDTIPTMLMQIQQCSRLYTAEYHIRKIITHDDVLRLKGNVFSQQVDIPLPLGERKIAIPLDATLKAYIDFGDFSEKNIERDGDRITLLLPDPQVVLTGSKIDRQHIHEYVGLTRAHFSDSELADYERQGRKAVLESVPQLGIIETARENAARVLVPMLVQLGYQEENISVAFRKDLDWRQLIKNIGG